MVLRTFYISASPITVRHSWHIFLKLTGTKRLFFSWKRALLLRGSIVSQRCGRALHSIDPPSSEKWTLFLREPPPPTFTSCDWMQLTGLPASLGALGPKSSSLGTVIGSKMVPWPKESQSDLVSGFNISNLEGDAGFFFPAGLKPKKITCLREESMQRKVEQRDGKRET